ncbi:Membrane protein implicated in regulation of membrane protease activity [Methanobrevibacter gottschalkii]|uniref:Membrane protein implicated in regulation of membrane protease activity n=1 Tax=Methanobrevibacter gottschalkii TaxID=190974 RepID=A0A1H7FIE0_9EURY|nr:NfeD family protein [Methanobrevibacter gottschalkii]SEK23890.1 Membrane protein implicated in regulation of membrane protease activity [Methanobrevibacter gottschalkii]
MEIFIWIILAILFFLLEILTGSFILVWFGISSIVAAVLNYFKFDFYTQFGAFIVISIILLVFTKKFAIKVTPEINKKTTAERLIGRNAKVVRKIDDKNIIVKVSGEEWSAYAKNNVDIGDTVKVCGIESIKLIVE